MINFAQIASSEEPPANREVLREIKELNQDIAELLEKRGDAYFSIKKFELAIADYSESIRLDRPFTDPVLYRKRVFAAVLLGAEDRALEFALEFEKDGCQIGQSLMAVLESKWTLVEVLSRSNSDKVRDPVKALKIAKEAEFAGGRGRHDVVEFALAMAYSANHDFEAAAEHQERGLELTTVELNPQYKAQLESYRNKKEFRFRQPVQETLEPKTDR